MFSRLHASPSSQGYKPVGSDTLSNSVFGPDLTNHGHSQGDGVQRTGAIVPAKSYGDLKSLHGRSRGKKSRAMRWLVLRASGERQIFTLDKRQLIQTCRLEIPIRDMRLMDSALGNETLAQLLVRDNALVFSAEHVRLIIMHDKVVVPLDDLQPPGPPQPQPQAQAHLQPQASPAPERSGSGLASGPLPALEMKDRFLTHLEGVVTDWALQHGSTLAEQAATVAAAAAVPPPASNGGLGPRQASFGGTSAVQPLQQQPSAGGAAAAVPSGGGGGGTAAASSGAAAPLHPALRGSQLTAAAAAGCSAGGAAASSGAVGPAPGIMMHIGGPGSETASTNAFDPEYQPFEMLVLETALSEICTHLSREVDALQMTSQPALEALMKTADTANLEAVRRVKTQHARLVTRVTATREALERLMEDDDDMVRMCLTQQAHMRLAAVAAAAAAAHQQQHGHHHSHHHSFSATTPGPAAAGGAGAAAHSPPESPTSPSTRADAHQLAMLMSGSLSASYMRPASLAARAVRHQVGKKSGALGEALAEAAAVAAATAAAAAAGGPGSGGCGGGGCGGGGASAAAAGEVMEHDFLDVENLLESYAIIVDTTYQTLMSIGEYIDDTEDLINIQLDYSRNKLIRFDILLTTGTFALAFFNIVTGMLGENLVLPDTITQDLSGFMLVNGGTLVFCITTFLSLVMVFKWQKVL